MNTAQLSKNLRKKGKAIVLAFLLAMLISFPAFAATTIPFTVNLSKAVTVTGTPRIALDVGGVTRYATYSTGSGTSVLTFTYAMVTGDVDLDGVTIIQDVPTSTYLIDLNGGTIKDLAGNNLSPLTFTPPNTTNVKVNYPSLGMDFIYDADGRYTLNGLAYNDLSTFLSAASGTFTRPSIGTYFNSTGILQTAATNVPRFDYDPNTNAAKGILIEESRTNLIPNGQGIGASGSNLPTGWSVDQAFGGISPSSTSSTINSKGYGAFQFTINGTTSFGNRLLITPVYFPYSAIAVSPNTAYTMSWGAELMGGSYPYGIQINFQWFNSSGTYLSSTSGTNRTSISGFTRYADTTTSPANAATVKIRFDFTGYGTGGTNVNFTMQLSGVQLEQGSFATSYIPTTTAAVTRAADTLFINNIGLWSNTSKSTLFSIFSSFGTTVNRQIASFGDGSSPYYNGAQRIGLSSTNTLEARQQTTSGESLTGNYTGPPANTIKKISFASDIAGTGSVAIDGTIQSLSQTGTAGTISFSKLGVGNDDMGTTQLNGYVQKFKYYPSITSNAQLQLMTQ